MDRPRLRITPAVFVSIFVVAAAHASHAAGQNGSAPSGAGGIEFLTGDSWSSGRGIVRLYGVQACLRGTFYTDGAGNRQDCGQVSLAYLAAVFRDTLPECKAVAQVARQSGAASTILSICSAKVGGAAVDLGSILISQGFAFAARSEDGKAVYEPYAVQEMWARQQKRGLWAFRDIPEPFDQFRVVAR